MRSFDSKKFVLMVALPLLASSIGIVSLTYDLVTRISTGANLEDHQRTRETVGSALAATKIQLRDIAVDNSFWDGAANAVYPTINEDWISETWGTSTKDQPAYNAALVFDVASHRVLSGYRYGVPFQPELLSYARQMATFIEDAHLGEEATTAFVDILETIDGLAIVSISSIVHTSPGHVLQPKDVRYLLMFRYLTDDTVTSIGRQYVVDGLSISTTEIPARSSELLTTASRLPLYISWKDRRPGDIARIAVLPGTFIALGVLMAVSIGIGAFCWLLIRSIARREEHAVAEAHHDALTGLLNRAGLLARIAELGDGPLTLAFADLDGFKDINDTYDHETGDWLIRIIASGIKLISEPTSPVAWSRLGGDEFVVVFAGTTSEACALEFGRNFIEFVRQPFNLGGRQALVGVSIGIASREDGRLDLHELMRRADVAMYRAKQTGKNRCCSYELSYDRERIENNGIAAEMRQIIDQGSLEVSYQPIIDASTRTIVCLEALARWPSNSARHVGPDRFIPIAEASGLIDDLGAHVLKRACVDARGWPDDIRFSVNISPLQLHNPEFVDQVLRCLDDHGIKPTRIDLEITEGIFVDDLCNANNIFRRLQEHGIRLVLDDFGSGFSSIGYLKTLNFNSIKIDKSMTDYICDDESKRNILTGTMAIAQGLATDVIIEGVERREQVEILLSSGCRNFQGHYFYKAMTASSVNVLIEKMRSADYLHEKQISADPAVCDLLAAANVSSSARASRATSDRVEKDGGRCETGPPVPFATTG